MCVSVFVCVCGCVCVSECVSVCVCVCVCGRRIYDVKLVYDLCVFKNYSSNTRAVSKNRSSSVLISTKKVDQNWLNS